MFNIISNFFFPTRYAKERVPPSSSQKCGFDYPSSCNSFSVTTEHCEDDPRVFTYHRKFSYSLDYYYCCSGPSFLFRTTQLMINDDRLGWVLFIRESNKTKIYRFYFIYRGGETLVTCFFIPCVEFLAKQS